VMDDRQQTAIQALEEGAEKIQAPLQRIEHALHVPVSFVIVPLFVLANAGVSLDIGALSQEVLSPVSLGVFIGLVLGKQIGITLFAWLAVKLNWAQLPSEVTWGHVYGIGWPGGIGFTMSLFIAELAFGNDHPEFLNEAKVGILLALIVASAGGYFTLRWQAAQMRQEDSH
jgi:NhaA family Na+:H+ antiporter